jgi:hypothetical protein
MPRYKVAWDNGLDACGVFPQVFDSYAEAEAYGQDWADECNVRDFGTADPDPDDHDVDGVYTYEVTEEED